MLSILIWVFCIGDAWQRIKVTQWIDPEGRRPITFKEYQAKKPINWADFKIGRVYEGKGYSDKHLPLVNVLVNSAIYPSIVGSLNQYVQNLESSGYTVVVDTTLGGTPDSIREHLKSQLSRGLVGAVLIGDLPVPWFQHKHVWRFITPLVEEFPIDLYYMDLDGVWLDTLRYDSLNDTLIPGCDSIFDTHSGAMEPDIWVGRLTASPLTWESESYLLNRYFEKNHSYRRGRLSLNDSALNYVDDDWIYSYDLVHPGLDSIYKSVIVVTHPGTTCANDYKPRLKDNYEWIGIFCHSSPFAHHFISYGSRAGEVRNSDIYSIRPRASFYNLFACSNARYVEDNYMAGWYTFVDSFGLAAVGSTKIGSMLEFHDFYHPLGEGKTLGEAFKHWFTLWGEARGDTSRSWFYGMTLIGDPTLSPKHYYGMEERAEVRAKRLELKFHPNPFTQSIVIRILGELPTQIEIYDLGGRLVKSFQVTKPQIIWEGRDNFGKELESGVYFINFIGITKKVIKM